MKPARLKATLLRPGKNIGTTVALVLRTSAAMLALQAGSRTRNVRRSKLDTSPDGKTISRCPSFSHPRLSLIGRRLAFAEFFEANGSTKMKSSRISGIALSR